MMAALGAAVVGIPRDHAALPAVARYAMEVALPRWGLTEPVNEIVYGTRGFDTFGETFLLLAAVVSVVMITRSAEPRRGYFGESWPGRGSRPRRTRRSGPMPASSKHGPPSAGNRASPRPVTCRSLRRRTPRRWAPRRRRPPTR